MLCLIFSDIYVLLSSSLLPPVLLAGTCLLGGIFKYIVHTCVW